MKSIVLAAAIGLALATSASAQSLRKEGGAQVAPLATSDPFKVIYRVPGVRDNGGGANLGAATSIMCTSYSPTTETLRYTVARYTGETLPAVDRPITLRETVTASTHLTAPLFETVNLATGVMDQGSIVVSSTTTNVHCTAMIVNAESALPNGIALHMIRFNPHPGSVE